MGLFAMFEKKSSKQSLPMKIFFISHILEKANVGPTQEYKQNQILFVLLDRVNYMSSISVNPQKPELSIALL